MKQPNILLIMTDEMRGDCVGVRHPDVKSPYLDTLIARGTYFPNAVTACPSCMIPAFTKPTTMTVVAEEL